MPAPPAELVTACREGDAYMHTLFFLDHPDGDIYAWDGIGEIVIGGNTYLGVGGFGSVKGVSDSADLQNHEVVCTLNAISVDAVADLDTPVQNRDADVSYVWLNSDKTEVVAGPLLKFRGHADFAALRPSETELVYQLTLKNVFGDWSLSPEAFYHPADQAKEFSGDTGFDKVVELEDKTLSGWSINVETSGGGVLRGGTLMRSDVTLLPMECGGEPCLAGTTASAKQPAASAYPTGAVNIVEETTSAAVKAASSADGSAVQVGGNPVYVDALDVVRTAGGNRIVAGSDEVNTLADVLTTGTATATTVQAEATYTVVGTASEDYKVMSVSGDYVVPNRSYGNFVRARIDNGDGTANAVASTNSTFFSAGNIIEETTGDAVEYVPGSNTFETTSGDELRLSTTGAIVTATGGNRVYPSGTDVDDSFLRRFV